MGKWTIYRKNGDVVAVTGILDAGKFVLPELSYSGTWMGERFVTVSVKSPYPIDWQIGDYLIYRGEKFVLNYDPTVVKKARKGTSGEGFVYDGVKFNSLSCECGDVRFLDEVLQDSHIHYTSLSSFTFFAATADDLADRLQANMNRYCSANGFSVSDWWLILTPSLERSRARALASGGSALAEEAVSRWNEFYTDGVSVDGERFNQNVSVSDISVLDGFALLYNLFGLHFITSGRTLAAGVSGKIAEHIFEYGKGKGLYELEKVADGNQAIVTKLFAYGNSTNLPVRYYARLNKTCFAKVRSVETGGSSFVIDIPFASSYYNGSENPSVASGSFQVTFLYEGKQYTCYVASDRGYPVSKQEGYSYLSAFIGGIPSLSVGDTITFVSGIDDDKWPSGHFSYVNDGSVLPDNLAISHLMLPGFPSESLRSWVMRNGGVEKGEGLIAWRGYEAYFSEDPLSPYVQSANAKKLGVRESSLVFDGSNGTDDIHPTITGSGKDVVVRCDMIADNGIFGEGEEVPNFHLVIPSLGEDVSLDILLRSDAKISMKDGYCGGTEFNIESVNVVEDGWELTLNRAYDDALQLYFPYSFGASLGNEPSSSESYQIRKGDTFVLLGIELPSSYIGMASERLLEGALQSLSGNDYTRHTYVPRVDEIYMARQHDAVVRGVDELQYGTVSLHDTLREGDLMRFEDADLSVGGTIFIDQLQIKEYGNKQIPTYDVTLRESKSVGTIERIQQEIDALSQNKSGGGGGGVSTSQVKSILNMYGDKRYIRRDIDDETDTILGAKQFVAKEKIVADRIKSKTEDVPVVVENDLSVEGNSSVKGNMNVEGKATFNQSVHALKEIVLGLNAEGKDKVLRSAIYEAGMKGWAVDKNGNAELESLKVRGYLETEELRINRLQGQEGDTIFTDNDKIEAVEEEVDETDGTTYYTLTLAEKWKGYFTAQQYGNICKGIVNTLAENYLAQQQGREPSVNINASGQEADAGGNKYFTSWFYVVATHNTDSRLGLNQIRVVLFGESQIPQDKNFAPCVGMSFGRWGCLNYATSDTPDYELADIKRRQRFFYISVSEGRTMHLKGVYQPILESWMFGTTMGELPDFVKNNESIKDRLVDNEDYFYSQGVVVSDFIKIAANGAPVPVTWFGGDWVDGSKIDNPTIGNGIYLASEYNPDNRQYEVHEVRHKSGRWRCLQHQPVEMNGVAVYHEPKWNSHYWRLVDGNENYNILFQSSMGMSFHRGHVDTEVTPRLMYGNVDISEDVAEQFWSWKRYTDSGETLADKVWSAQHEGVKVLHLTNEDMPQEWNSKNRAIFEVNVTLDDGKEQIIISNYIIA